jgi:hypothetical protein
MPLTHVQLTTYLLEVREIVQLMLGRFAEIRELSDRWVKAKDSEDRQLEEWQTGLGLDDEQWGSTIESRGTFQAQYFSAVEAFLAGWARLSLLIFPLDGKGRDAGFRSERGIAIRTALVVGPTSALADRDLRDSWMHFDERLDRAFVTGTFRERHRFVRSTEAADFIGSTVKTIAG